VAQNLFKDTNTVIVDSTKTVSDPSVTGSMDGYNVNGWWSLGGNTLGLSRWWYDPGSVVGGYKSILESDVWYTKDKSWTTDWNTAVNNGNIIDLQSVATHELGHSIGMGDLYTLSDARKNDYAQVMNLYDAPQRALGNGDRTGAQVMYGTGTISPTPSYMALRAYNGQYVCAEGGGGREVVANRNAVNAWETFKLLNLGNNNVALQAYNGQYVCAEGGGGREVVANRNAVNAWETFKLLNLGNNNVALQAYNGQYVCAEGGGGREVVANRNAVNAWETFRSSS
jgi:hypothetical protein